MIDKKGCLFKILVFTLFLLIHTLIVNASSQDSESQGVEALVGPARVYIVSYFYGSGIVSTTEKCEDTNGNPTPLLTELDKPQNLDKNAPFSNQYVTIYAVLRARELEAGGPPRYFIDSTETFKCVKFKGKVDTEYLLEVWNNNWGTPEFKWYYFQPEYTRYYPTRTNPNTGKLEEYNNEKTFFVKFKLVDVSQWVFGWGTMKSFKKGTKRYVVELDLNGEKYYSPEGFGEWLKNKGYTISQLTQNYDIPSSEAFKAHRISVRDKQFTHQLLLWASSYINVNYIFGALDDPHDPSHNDVQAYKGTDCADLVLGAQMQLNGGYPAGLTPTSIGATDLYRLYKGDPVGKISGIWVYQNEVYKDDQGNIHLIDLNHAEPGDLVFYGKKGYDDKNRPYSRKPHVLFYVGRFVDENGNTHHRVVEARAAMENQRVTRRVVNEDFPKWWLNIFNHARDGSLKYGDRVVRARGYLGDLNIQESFKGQLASSKIFTISVDPSVIEMYTILFRSSNDTNLVFYSPNGTIYDEFYNDADFVFFSENESNDLAVNYFIYNPTPGNWTLNFTGSSGENYTISIFFDSNLTLELITDKEQYDINDTIILQANLTNSSGGVPGATVIAEIENPDSTAINLTLYDDGTHGDDTANDGLYTNSFSNTLVEGTYSIDITADGTVDGYKFIRKLQSSREVFPQTASLNNSYSDNAIDKDGNGFYDYLTINIGVNITQAGSYRISGWLYFNESFIVSASNYTSLTIGVHNIDLNFDGVAIYKSKVNGPYSLNVVIYDEQERELDYGYGIYNTSSYNYLQFERPIVELDGSYSHYTNDTDSDGFYDYLAVQIGMNVSVAGNYTVKAWLEDVNDSSVTETSNYSYFDVGLQTKQIKFDGLSIYQAGIDGTYILSVEVYDANYSLIDYAYDTYNTSSYNYTQFQPPGALLSDSYSDYGKDTDGNGLYDYLVIEVGVNVSKAGNYSLYGWILDVNESDVGNANNFTYLNTGLNTITLNFDGLELYKYKKDGPYRLDHLVLYNAEDRGLDSRESMFDDTTNSTQYIYNTSAYSYKQFQKPVVDFINYTDYGEDTNGNGLYEYLIIEAGVNITKAGNYILLAHPTHNTANYTLSDIIYTFLDMSNKTIKFKFNGEAIYNFKKDGIFTLNQIIVYNSTGSIVNHLINNLYNTSLYNYTQFDTSPTGSLFIIKSGGNNISIFDSAGNLFLKNTLTQSTTPTDTADDEFLLRDDSNTVVAKINSTGYMEIKGTLFQNQGSLTNPPGDDFLIKDDSGNVVVRINESGYLFLKGSLYENSIS